MVYNDFRATHAFVRLEKIQLCKGSVQSHCCAKLYRVWSNDEIAIISCARTRYQPESPNRALHGAQSDHYLDNDGFSNVPIR
jgi:hypothetical protein